MFIEVQFSANIQHATAVHSYLVMDALDKFVQHSLEVRVALGCCLEGLSNVFFFSSLPTSCLHPYLDGVWCGVVFTTKCEILIKVLKVKYISCQIAELLLQNGAHVNVQDKTSAGTPLHRAASRSVNIMFKI